MDEWLRMYNCARQTLGPLGHHSPNLQAIRYSKAATAVRGASYKLEAPIAPGQLPFVGSTTAAQIDDILRMGSCQALDHFRFGLVYPVVKLIEF